MDGSVSVVIEGASYPMRPGYDAMRSIEAHTHMTIAELLECLTASRIKMEEAVLIVWYGCIVDSEFDSIEHLGNLLFKLRITDENLRASIAQFLLGCLWQPEAAKKKWLEEVAPILSQEPIG